MGAKKRQTVEDFRLFSSIPDPIIIVHGSNIIFSNDAAKKLFVLDDKSDSSPMDFFDFLDEESQEKFGKLFAIDSKGSSSSRSKAINHKIIDSIGNSRYVRTKFSKFDIAGKPHFILSIHCLNDEEMTKSALKHSEKKFESIFNKVSDAILVLHDNVIIDCNASAPSFFGLGKKDDLFGKDFIKLSNPEKNNPMIRLDKSSNDDSSHNKFEKILNGYLSDVDQGISQNYNWVFLSNPGSENTVQKQKSIISEVELQKLELGHRKYVLVFIRDITERENYENELRNSSEQIKKILNGATESIMLIDSNKQILEWNDSIVSKTGFSRNEVIWKKVPEPEYDSENKFENNLSSLWDMINLTFSTQKVNLDEHEIYDKFGNKRFLISQSSIIKNSDGSINSIVIVSRDVSDNKINADEIIHGKSYLSIKEGCNEISEIINSFMIKKYKTLYVARDICEEIEKLSSEDISARITSDIAKETNASDENISELWILQDKVLDFISRNDNSLVFINNLEYYSITCGYDQTLKFLYKIKDNVKGTSNVFIIKISENYFSSKQISFLEEEFLMLPSKHNAEILLSKNKINILKFINNRISMNLNVQYGDISREIKLSRITTKKWIDDLRKDGFLTIEKSGRSKYINLTKKCKIFLEQM